MTYATYTSASTGTSDIKVVGIRETISGPNAGDVTTTTLTGTRVNTTGTHVLSGGAVAITGSFTSVPGYDYVERTDVLYTQGGTTYDVDPGIVGIVTDVSDVPSAGLVTYTGQTNTAMATSTSITSTASGTATVQADFSGGQVDVTLNLTNPVAPVDQVLIDNMAISGNSFTGGNISTLNNGSVVAYSGSSLDSADGAFFGYDGAVHAPDEVGGVFIAAGSGGAIVGDFVAD